MHNAREIFQKMKRVKQLPSPLQSKRPSVSTPKSPKFRGTSVKVQAKNSPAVNKRGGPNNVPHLGDLNVYKKAEILERTQKWFPHEVVKEILKYISNPRHLLKFRLVDSSWEDAVAEILPEKCTQAYSWNPYSRHLNFSSDVKLKDESLLQLPGMFFKQPKHITNFIADSDNHHPGNPFLTGVIKFSADVCCHSKLDEYFSFYAEDITIFVLNAHLAEIDDWVGSIPVILQKLVNLRVLKLIGVARYPKDVGIENISEEFEWLEEPLPQLKHLKSLTLSECEDYMVLDAFLKAYGNQLTSLSCEGSAVEESEYLSPIGDSTEQVPGSIKKLKLFKAYDAMENLPNIWKLTHLSIEETDSYFDYSLKKYLAMVQPFKETLNELYLHIDGEHAYENIDNWIERMEVFPHLTKCGLPYTFLMELRNRLQKFLQKLVTLKELEFVHWASYESSRMDYKRNRMLYGDNLGPRERTVLSETIGPVWKWVPTLKNIRVLHNVSDFKIAHVALKPTKANQQSSSGSKRK